MISIHALREESDCIRALPVSREIDFNPRPPRGERPRGPQRRCALPHFNPRPPRGERPTTTGRHGVSTSFQSTPSARRATGEIPRYAGHHRISIHALREESDLSIWTLYADARDFNPRPPRGERLQCKAHCMVVALISIHALREESDRGGLHMKVTIDISIHALREESDPPWHRRTCWPKHISIHALREESDWFTSFQWSLSILFQSTPSARRATADRRLLPPLRRDFNPRPPRGERPVSDVELRRQNRFQSTPSARRATTYLLLL